MPPLPCAVLQKCPLNYFKHLDGFFMNTAAFWIDRLKLIPHPEGGFYKESYRAAETIPAAGLPSRFGDLRNFSTAIYFLLRSQDRSLFHRIKSDELWHFHAGKCLSIFVLDNNGLTVHKLGSDPDKGEALQVVIPANCWFGAKLSDPETYTLPDALLRPVLISGISNWRHAHH